jgi:hypothetical protein
LGDSFGERKEFVIKKLSVISTDDGKGDNRS